MQEEIVDVNTDAQEVVNRTWSEVGYKITPLRKMVFVKTDPVPQKVGSLYLPPKLATFYGELPNLVLVNATVLAAGPKASVRPGDRVCFTRLFFARYCDLQDGTYIGWIEEENLTGRLEE